MFFGIRYNRKPVFSINLRRDVLMYALRALVVSDIPFVVHKNMCWFSRWKQIASSENFHEHFLHAMEESKWVSSKEENDRDLLLMVSNVNHRFCFQFLCTDIFTQKYISVVLKWQYVCFEYWIYLSISNRSYWWLLSIISSLYTIPGHGYAILYTKTVPIYFAHCGLWTPNGVIALGSPWFRQ